MRVFKKIFVFLFFIISINSFAADIPKELHGKYVTSDQSCEQMFKAFKEVGEWDGIQIDAKGKSSYESRCNATKVSGSKGNYTIKLSCESEEGPYSYTAKFKKEGNNLVISDKEMNLKYISCDTKK